MTDKVIYVSFVRLTDKMSRDWYVDFLAGKGVNVEYWDIVALVRNEYTEPNARTAAYLRTVRTYGQLEGLLRLPENRNARYMMLVSYTGVTARLFRLFSKYNAKMLYMAWGALPEMDAQKRRGLKSRFADPLHLAKRIYYRIKAVAYRKLHLVKPFDTVFAAGQVLMKQNQHARRVVPVNLVDYDHYNQARGQGARAVAGRYAVFLDVYLPHHSDMEFAGGRKIDAHRYYQALNRFWGLLEIKYKIKVVIAAHPKADYSDNPFDGREVFHSRTPELVRDAEFVVAHHSTSLSYAVLNQKRLLFIYTNEMAALCKTIVSYLYGFARYLDAAVCNIDEIAQADQIVLGEINARRYEAYKYDFLTSPESEHETTQEIFWREISAVPGAELAVGAA